MYDGEERDVSIRQEPPKTRKKAHRPRLLSTGIVKLSSQPKISTSSLTLAMRPVNTLITPNAAPPPMAPAPSFQPKARVASCGNANRPWNMYDPAGSFRKAPVLGTSQPQNIAAVRAPVAHAARLPASDFPRRRRMVYLPYNLPKVLAAVSPQLRSMTLTTPMSFGKNCKAMNAPKRYQITPL